MSILCKMVGHSYTGLSLWEYQDNIDCPEGQDVIIGWFQYYKVCKRCGNRKDLFKTADYGVKLKNFKHTNSSTTASMNIIKIPNKSI